MTVSVKPQVAGSVPLRVMVVDDSAVVRGVISRWLGADPEIMVVASCSNGASALSKLTDVDCDVVVLDIEMPVMDGLSALPRLLRAAPGLQIVMASTLTRRNADASLRALSLGAADYVTKPASLTGGRGVEDFRLELLAKVKGLGAARRDHARAPSASWPDAGTGSADDAVFSLRPMPSAALAVLAIGSSTGGPNALLEVFREIGPALRIPVLVTQHMPPTFTTLLAEHLGRVSGRPSGEARDGQAIEDGHIYVAPGGYHMEIARRAGAPTIRLTTNPPENFCRPAVDPLFRSVASAYGARALGLVLTGMGCDGREGARAIVAAGGAVVAQDEQSSVVWGMPGAVALAGLCSAVWPLKAIGGELLKCLSGSERRVS